MKKHTQKAHDKFFRKVFSNIHMARTYFLRFLPSSIVHKLDLADLQASTESYVTPELEAYYSDIVYTCPYGKYGEKILVTLLLEHKSQVPQFPYLQLLRYMLEIWNKQIAQKEPLTVVIPIIFYHGKQKWKTKSFESYFNIKDDSLKQYLPAFEYFLTDLSNHSDEQLLLIRMSFLVKALLALKHAYDKEYLVEQFLMFFDFPEIETEKNLSTALLVYLLKITEIKGNQLDILLNQSPQSTKSFIMSTYDMIAQEHFEKGQLEGIEKGQEKSLKKIITNMLINKFTPVDIAKLTDLSIQKVLEIKAEIEKQKSA